MITPQVFGDAAATSWRLITTTITRKPASIRFSYRTTSPHPKRRSAGVPFQVNYPQDKLVRAIRGEVFDVAVDLRPGSKTYGQWYGVLLSEENKKQFFIPKNFAHGFVVLSDYAEFAYKCTDFYHPNDEGGLAWNDPQIGVEWPIPEGMELTLSDKDKKWGSFAEFTESRNK